MSTTQEQSLAIATEALRDIAITMILDAQGIVPPASTLRDAPAAQRVLHALHALGELEKIERHEHYSGENQVIWQGQRLRDYGRPSHFVDGTF